MAWYQTGEKTLSEPVIAEFTDAYTGMCHLGLNVLTLVVLRPEYF